MQKRLHFAVLVKGLFLAGKKSFRVGLSPRTINREPFGPTGQTGAPVNFFLQQTSSGNLGVCLKREPASQQYLEKRIFLDGLPKCPAGGNLVEENRQLQGEQNEPSPLR